MYVNGACIDLRLSFWKGRQELRYHAFNVIHRGTCRIHALQPLKQTWLPRLNQLSAVCISLHNSSSHWCVRTMSTATAWVPLHKGWMHHRQNATKSVRPQTQLQYSNIVEND